MPPQRKTLKPKGPSYIIVGMTLQPLMRGLLRREVQRHLVGDADAVAFEGYDLLRVIRHHANVFQSQIDQNLRPDATFMLHHALPRRLAIQLTPRVKMSVRE